MEDMIVEPVDATNTNPRSKPQPVKTLKSVEAAPTKSADTKSVSKPKAGAKTPGVKLPSSTASSTKADLVLKKLRGAKGATIAMLSEATNWQAHSMRGFLSAVVKKKLGLNLQSETGKDGVRRYRIIDDTGANG